MNKIMQKSNVRSAMKSAGKISLSILLLFLLFMMPGCDSGVSDSKHIHYASPDTPLNKIIKEQGLTSDNEYHLKVELYTQTLYFMYQEDILKRYRISAGKRSLLGDKKREGDLRTPRGEFYICSKAVFDPPKGNFGTRWMQFSYPNLEAAARGLKDELISDKVNLLIEKAFNEKKTPPQDTALGGGVGIHGGARLDFPKNWTAGCIGMYNQDIEEIFNYVHIKTRLDIIWEMEYF